MSARFTELDWRVTPMGEISLRRRVEPTLGVDVYEVKLGDEYLMSSLFTVAEEQLARLALAALPDGETERFDVLVGGLGLGYTAAAVLADPRVRSMTVVEALEPVIGWHRDGVLPGAETLTGDPRTCLRHGDFFALVASVDPAATVETMTTVEAKTAAERRWHAIVVDIDHTPSHLLHPSHGGFYTATGLRRLAVLLHPGGVFALWSDDPPDATFSDLLANEFVDVDAVVVPFANHLTGGTSTNTVYRARRPPSGP